MTDARFPDRWLSDRRIMRLTAEHFRSFMTSLAWSVTNRTDGFIHPDDLGLIPHFSAGAPKAFVAAGLWSPLDKGWVITEFQMTQTTREQLAQLDAARVKEREKKARQRAAKAAASTSTDEPVPRDVPQDVPQEYTGQDRQGQDRQPSRGLPTGRNGSPFDMSRGGCK